MTFLTAKQMFPLAKRYLRKSHPIDILSFTPSSTNRNSASKLENCSANDDIGFIYMCPELIAAQSVPRYSLSSSQRNKSKRSLMNVVPYLNDYRVLRMAIHGYCHIIGHDHVKSHDYRQMISTEWKMFKRALVVYRDFPGKRPLLIKRKKEKDVY